MEGWNLLLGVVEMFTICLIVCCFQVNGRETENAYPFQDHVRGTAGGYNGWY